MLLLLMTMMMMMMMLLMENSHFLIGKMRERERYDIELPKAFSIYHYYLDLRSR